MNILDGILRTLTLQPKSSSQLAHDLALGQATVDSALLQLSRGNYISEASQEGDHCGPACNSCSMTNLCGNAHQEKAAVQLWRLTEKGEKRARPQYSALRIA